MTHPPAERLRSYVEGETDVTARLLVEAHLSLCQRCSADIAAHQCMRGRLPAATLHDELDLPPFDRMWTAAEQAMTGRRRAEAAVLPPQLLAALPHPSGWRWIAAWPRRVKIALLIRDADTRSELYLCHFAAGSTFPHHYHLGLEENVILAGGYRNGNIQVNTGDWVIGAPGTEEASRAEGEECWCLSRIEPPGVRFAGWRRWVAPLFSR